MTSTFTTNRGYRKQGTGDNPNTWGALLNTDVFDIIDKNLGSTLSISVAGSSNVTLTASQAQNMIHRLTGILTGNINYIFPAAGGFFFISNETTGAFTITVKPLGGTGILIPQGTVVAIYIDGVALTANGAIGTTAAFTGVAVTGTPNALVVAQTTPANFTLYRGVFVTVFPTATNTGAITLNVAGSGVIAVKKLAPSGLVDFTAGDTASGVPLVVLYDGTYWVSALATYEGATTPVGTNQSIGFTDLFKRYVTTAACTFTISRTSTTLATIWYIDIDARGGDVTLTPDANDSINGGAAGASFVINKGQTCRLYTDANGNLYTEFVYLTVLPNTLINGAFDVWQRGTSFTPVAGTVTYTADRWFAWRPTNANYTISQVAATSVDAFYAIKAQRTNGTSNTNDINVGQVIESIDARKLAGKTCRLSLFVKAGANFSAASSILQILVNTGTGTDEGSTSLVGGSWAGNATPLSANQAITTTMTRYDFAVAIPSTTKEIAVRWLWTPVGTAGADDSVTVEKALLTEGNSVTPFPFKNYEDILLDCQRFLPAFNPGSGPVVSIGGQCTGTTSCIAFLPFVVPPRVRPTGVTISNVSHFNVLNAAASGVAVSTAAYNALTGLTAGVIEITVASGLVTGNATSLLSVSASAQILFTGAEL